MTQGFNEGQIIVHKLGSIESDIQWIKSTLIDNENLRSKKIADLEAKVTELRENQVKSRNFLAGIAVTVSIVFSILMEFVLWLS